jgi:hypothetical protein
MFSTRINFTFALLLSSAVLVPAAALSKEAKAIIAIEQGGAVVPVQKDGTVTLRKAPFSIVSTLKGPSAILVSASASDALVKPAKKQRVDEPFTNQFKAQALESKNSDESLLVQSDPRESYGYYVYRGPDDYTFSEVNPSGAELTGKLSVSKLNVDGTKVPVAQYSGNDIYLVFATTESKGGKDKVTWSDSLHIHFAP